MVYREELQGQQTSSNMKYRVSMTDMNFLVNLTLPPPKGGTGNIEQLDELCYKMRAYMNSLSPCYDQILRRVEENPYIVIRYEELHEVQQLQGYDGTTSQLDHVCLQDRLARRYAVTLQ